MVCIWEHWDDSEACYTNSQSLSWPRLVTCGITHSFFAFFPCLSHFLTSLQVFSQINHLYHILVPRSNLLWETQTKTRLPPIQDLKFFFLFTLLKQNRNIKGKRAWKKPRKNNWNIEGVSGENEECLPVGIVGPLAQKGGIRKKN